MKTFSIFDFRISISGSPPALGSALARDNVYVAFTGGPAKSKFEIRNSKI